jgi:hypothetical protein
VQRIAAEGGYVTPGYHKIPAEKYHADPAIVPSLNASVAKILLRESARKAWFSHPRLNPAFARKEEAKFDIGTASHAMLLEGQNVIQVCEFDDWRTKDARVMRDAARAAGKVPLLKKNRDDVVAMVATAEAFIAHSEIAEYWPDGESELTAICEERGVWMRCLLDRITKRRRFIFDYKSTEDASPDTFGRQIVRMGYHIQEAFYRRVVRNLGEIAPRFVFLAQSCEPPYECSLHGCDPALQEIADAEVQRAIDIWRDCSQKKVWPSHGGRIHWALPPTYLMNQHEERLAA